MKKNKIVLYFLILIIIPIMLSCSNSKSKEKNKINILITKDTIGDEEEFKLILNNYIQAGNEVNILEIESEKLEAELIAKEKIDIIFTDRTNMINLSDKGLVKSLNSYYVENKLLDKLNSFNISYCRNKTNYYGVSVNPYSIVIMVNKNWAMSNGISKENNMRDIFRREINIPYILPNNTDVEMLLSALIANNEGLSWQLSDSYGKSNKEISAISSGKNMFVNFNKFIKEGEIKKEKFYALQKEEIKRFNNGEIPILMTSSLISKKIDEKLDVIVIDKFKVEGIETNGVGSSAGILLVTSRSEDDIENNSFLDFVVKKEKLLNIIDAGIITGNKMADDNLDGNKLLLKDTIINYNENNIIYYENLSKEIKMKLYEEVKKSFNGLGNEEQWSNIVS